LSMNLFAVGEPSNALCRKAEPALTHLGVDLRHEGGPGTLAMSVVHDLRNPLAAIHSGAEMLNGSQLPEQQVRRLASNIRNASIRIEELLQDYVDLCRARERHRTPASLHSLVAQAVDRIADMADAHSVAVVQDVPAGLVVTVERGRIGSVLGNLLANALEAMATGGSIHISAIATGGSVVLRVRDTGPGIPPEIHDRLFQPFVTARKPKGWGLGLAQARQTVIEHGGEMWVESTPGGGACFGFSLPT
jgi:signal transduction histidine kinase